MSPTKKQKSQSGGKLWFGAVCLAIFFMVFAVALLVLVLLQASDSTVASNNRASLLAITEMTHVDGVHADIPIISEISTFDAQMRAINPDFISWITIEGTPVDYPVVRASDNDTYLNLSFMRERNIHGAIFMDYRNVGESVPNIIIYGHNVRDGSKFGSLRNFLDEEFLTNHRIITLRVNERVVKYEIFSARLTDVNDPAYFLDFSAPGSFRAFLERNGAPLDATQIITLSTCVSRGDNDERLIVQGALICQ